MNSLARFTTVRSIYFLFYLECLLGHYSYLGFILLKFCLLTPFCLHGYKVSFKVEKYLCLRF